MSATVIEDLAAEFAISKDSTLSRVVYRDDRLRVVGFAFDAGQELTEHTSALPVVIQVVRGLLELTLGSQAETPASGGAAADGASGGVAADGSQAAGVPGEVTIAAPGCWVHLPARMPHTVRAVEPSVMLLTMLPPDSK